MKGKTSNVSINRKAVGMTTITKHNTKIIILSAISILIQIIKRLVDVGTIGMC